MASKVDMSLDDIIKSNKAGSRGRGRGRGRGGISRSPRGRGIVRGGSRGRSRGRGRGSFRSDSALRQIQTGRIGKSPRGFSTGSISTRWEHDRFEGGQGSRNRGGSGASRSAVKLVISNLDFGVNDQDLKELFGEFGGFVKANVHYDISGRSNGTAFIIMNSAEAAEQARKRYHGVQLDGRPMDIQIMGGNMANARAPLVQRFSTPRGRGARGAPSRGSGGVRGRGRGGRGGRGRGRPTPSKKELDDQLDVYNSQTD